MNDYQDDEVLARLRAADPATGAHPDLHRISERLRRQTPLGTRPASGYAQGTGYSFSDTSDTAIRVSDPGTRTSRVGFLVAASVAALAFAGGGYVVGAATTDDGNTGTVAGDSGDSGDDRGAREAGGAQEDSDDAGAEAVEDMAASEAYGGDMEMSSDSAMGGGHLGPVVPVAGEGLSTERTSGPVYAPDRGGDDPDAGALLEQYAGALAIEGTVDSDRYSAYVTDANDGRSLHVYAHGGQLSVDYSNPALDPYCEEYMAEPGGWFGEQGPDSIPCLPPGEVPDEATAIALAQEFADTMGIEDDGYEFRVETYDPVIAYDEGSEELMDESAATSAPEDPSVGSGSELVVDEVRDVSVTASRSDAPLRNYQGWYFGVTDQGVSYASLQLAEFVSLGTYPVISPAEAVERANDTRFQQIGAYIPDLEFEAAYLEEWIEPDPLPPLTAGAPIPYPLSESTVTAAELHPGVVSLWDGTEFIAPVYHLTDDQGNSWQVLGLAEEALDFTP